MTVKNDWVNGDTFTPAAANAVANAVNAGSPANLTVTLTGTTVTVVSSTGTDAVLAAADTTNAGIMTAAMQTKLAGIATAATANDTDTNLKNRANHTGTQTASTISDFSTAADARVVAGITGKLDTSAAPELIRDTIGTALVAGSNVTLTVNDPGDTITIAASGGSGSNTVSENTQTGTSYTLVLGDAANAVAVNNAAANTVTVPPNSSVAFPTGTVIEIGQYGAGQTTVVGGSGVTIRSAAGLKLRAQYSTAAIRKRATDEWWLAGDTTV